MKGDWQTAAKPRGLLLSGTLRPGLWICAVLFFVVATPFESDQSGVGYLIKVTSLAPIIVYAIAMRGAKLGAISAMPALIILSTFFINTVVQYSDRGMIAIASMLAGLLTGQLRGEKWERDLDFLFAFAIVVHLAAFLFAFIAYYGFGELVDVHHILFPRASRTAAYGAFARVSGLHTEPGTYAQWMVMYVLGRSLVRRSIVTPLHAIATASLLLTVSLWAIIVVVLVGLAMAVESAFSGGLKRRASKVSMIILVSLGLAATVRSLDSAASQASFGFLQDKADVRSETARDKLKASDFLSRELSTVILHGKPVEPGFCPECIAPTDAGLAVNALYYFGIVPTTLFAIALLVSVQANWGAAFSLLVIAVAVWKAPFFDPLLWVLVGYSARASLIGLPLIDAERSD